MLNFLLGLVVGAGGVYLYESRDETLLSNPKWSGKYINNLPDSAFLYVDKSQVSEKVAGRSHPLSSRHLPVKNHMGKYDCAHLRNAISRAPQTNLPRALQIKLQNKARRLYKQYCSQSRSF